jgi:hypothetical protein
MPKRERIGTSLVNCSYCKSCEKLFFHGPHSTPDYCITCTLDRHMSTVDEPLWMAIWRRGGFLKGDADRPKLKKGDSSYA